MLHRRKSTWIQKFIPCNCSRCFHSSPSPSTSCTTPEVVWPSEFFASVDDNWICSRLPRLGGTTRCGAIWIYIKSKMNLRSMNLEKHSKAGSSPQIGQRYQHIIITTFYLENISFLPRWARVGRSPQGQQLTFGDTSQELTQPLVDQSPSGSHLFMDIGASFWWLLPFVASTSCGLGKRRWNLKTSSAVVEFLPPYISNKRREKMTQHNYSDKDDPTPHKSL